MRKTLYSILFVFNIFIYAQEFTDLYGDYLGQKPPGLIPEVFARGIVSTNDLEHSPAVFSPDGNEVYWITARPPGPGNSDWLNREMTMRRIGNRWTVPVVSPYKGMLVFSPDGRKGYFWSHNERDIFVIEKQGDHWDEPMCLNILKQYPELKLAVDPSVTKNGSLYFMGIAEGLGMRYDYAIYRMKLINGKYDKPELLPRSINLPPFQSWTPFVAPDESYLIFSSDRSGQFGGGDLYISFHDINADVWSEPVNMGEKVNSQTQERLPGVSPDGKYLFFTRWTPDHNQDVFWISAEVIDNIKKNPNIANPIHDQLAYVNKEFTLTFPRNTFWDFKDTMFTYSAKLENGDLLPDWLTFDPKTRTFSGTPSANQILPISLTAEDLDRNIGNGNFQIAVIEYQTVDTNKIDLRNGVVTNYTFDGNTKDISSHNYHGEVNGAVLCEDRNGKKNLAYFFDGKDDFIEVQHVKELEIIGALTVSCWIKPLSYETSYSAWISKQNIDNSTSQFRFGFGQEPQNRWGFTLYRNGWRGYEFDNKIPFNKWSHVLLTLNMSDNTLNIYLNGELVHAAEQKQFLAISDASLFIGYQADNKCYFHGCIDDVVIYDRVLNRKEAIALYREGL